MPVNLWLMYQHIHKDDYHDSLQIDVCKLLPPSAPALAHLRELALNNFPLKDGKLSEAMLNAMTSLSFLRISRSDLTSVPATIVAAASLRVLKLDFNEDLRFGEDDISIIMNLPQLETLKMSMDESRTGWGFGSVASIMKLSKRLHLLEKST